MGKRPSAQLAECLDDSRWRSQYHEGPQDPYGTGESKYERVATHE